MACLQLDLMWCLEHDRGLAVVFGSDGAQPWCSWSEKGLAMVPDGCGDSGGLEGVALLLVISPYPLGLSLLPRTVLVTLC